MNIVPSSPADARLPQTLGEACEIFEAIRHLARSREDQAPDLFAAFMSAAAAAADGRDAVLTAAAAPPVNTPDADRPDGPAPGADPHQVADMTAASAAALAARLDHAADLTQTSEDRRACQDAATAAWQIHQLLARADDTDAR